MILAGGVVAWIADKLGRTLGKKRLTLFGMRPRHTATTITVVAGMLIPLITVLFVTAVSSQARQWIIEGNDALRQRDQLRKDNSDLEAQKQLAGEELNGIKKQKDDVEKQYHDVLNQLKTVNDKLTQAQTRLASVTKEVQVEQNQIRQLQLSLKSRQAALASAESKLKSASANLDSVSKQYSALNKQYTVLKTSYDEVYKQLQQANAEYLKVSTTNDQLTKLNTDLKASNDKASADLEKTKGELEMTNLTLDAAKSDLAQAKAQYAENLAKAAQYMNTQVGKVRLGHQTFASGDEVARIAIPAGCDETEARGLLANLIAQAVEAAKARGAKPNEEKGLDAAALFAADDQGNPVPTDMIEEQIIKGITNQNALVLVATCELNSYLGDPVPIDVHPYNNPIIYKRSDKVAETMINGNQSVATIVQHISDFLTTTLKPKALKDGMIPVAGQEQTFGNVPLTDLIDLADQINNSGRPIRLTAYAANDTRAGDSLRLSFRWR